MTLSNLPPEFERLVPRPMAPPKWIVVRQGATPSWTGTGHWWNIVREGQDYGPFGKSVFGEPWGSIISEVWANQIAEAANGYEAEIHQLRDRESLATVARRDAVELDALRWARLTDHYRGRGKCADFNCWGCDLRAAEALLAEGVANLWFNRPAVWAIQLQRSIRGRIMGVFR